MDKIDKLIEEELDESISSLKSIKDKLAEELLEVPDKGNKKWGSRWQ